MMSFPRPSEPAAVPKSVHRTEPLPVSIVIPCFNESGACDHLHEQLRRMESMLGKEYELSFIMVDDGSSDPTLDVLKSTFGTWPNVTLVRHDQNRGVAAAIMTGIREATTEIVCSMDSDCTYDPQQFANLIPLLRPGIDMVTASPYHPQGRVRNVPQWRLALSKMASRMYRQVLRNKLHTYTSCFRVYRRSSVVDVTLQNEGFVGVVELLWALDRRGSTIVECPAELGIRQYGQSKMRTLHVMLGHFRLMLKGPP